MGKSTLSHTSNLVKLVPPSFSKACAESMYLQKKKKDRTDKLQKHYTGRYNNEKWRIKAHQWYPHKTAT